MREAEALVRQLDRDSEYSVAVGLTPPRKRTDSRTMGKKGTRMKIRLSQPKKKEVCQQTTRLADKYTNCLFSLCWEFKFMLMYYVMF